MKNIIITVTSFLFSYTVLAQHKISDLVDNNWKHETKQFVRVEISEDTFKYFINGTLTNTQEYYLSNECEDFDSSKINSSNEGKFVIMREGNKIECFYIVDVNSSELVLRNTNTKSSFYDFKLRKIN